MSRESQSLNLELLSDMVIIMHIHIKITGLKMWDSGIIRHRGQS